MSREAVSFRADPVADLARRLAVDLGHDFDAIEKRWRTTKGWARAVQAAEVKACARAIREWLDWGLNEALNAMADES